MNTYVFERRNNNNNIIQIMKLCLPIPAKYFGPLWCWSTWQQEPIVVHVLHIRQKFMYLLNRQIPSFQPFVGNYHKLENSNVIRFGTSRHGTLQKTSIHKWTTILQRTMYRKYTVELQYYKEWYIRHKQVNYNTAKNDI